MTNGSQVVTFQVIYLAALAVQMIIRLPYWLRNRNRRVDSDRSAPLDYLLVRLVGNAMFTLPLLYVLTDWLRFADYRLPTWAGVVGAGFIAGALWLFWRSHADLGRHWWPTPEIRDQHELVTRGVYGSVRHPMYAAIFLWVAGQPLLLHNWVAGWADLVLWIPFYLQRVAREEEMLQAHFGEAYRAYMERTGRVLPARRRRSTAEGAP